MHMLPVKFRKTIWIEITILYEYNICFQMVGLPKFPITLINSPFHKR